MEMVKKICCLFLIFITCGACAPKPFIPREMKIHQFQPTPSYELNSDIILPDAPVKILLDKNFKATENMKEVKYIVFAPVEYKKIQGYLKAGKTYKEITTEQEILINTYIRTLNGLKEYISLQQLKADEYRQLWADAENSYRYEQYQHKVDNSYHKTVISLMGIGSIVIAILIL